MLFLFLLQLEYRPRLQTSCDLLLDKGLGCPPRWMLYGVAAVGNSELCQGWGEEGFTQVLGWREMAFSKTCSLDPQPNRTQLSLAHSGSPQNKAGRDL